MCGHCRVWGCVIIGLGTCITVVHYCITVGKCHAGFSWGQPDVQFS